MNIDKVKNAIENADDKIKLAGAIVAAGVVPDVVMGIAANGIVKIIKNQQLKQYNPVSVETFEGKEFNIPNMVMIVDDAKFKKIDDFKDAIGLLKDVEHMQVLELFDEMVEKSGLRFSSAPTCNTIYYVDPYDRSHFISTEELYETLQKQRIAELEDIAFCLGAKSYSIEIFEEMRDEKEFAEKAKIKGQVKVVEAGISEEHETRAVKKDKCLSRVTAELEGREKPIAPKLVWFKEDQSITGLVRHILEGEGGMRSREFTFECSKFAVMSTNTAAQIDAAVKKLSANVSANLKTKTEKEFNKKIVYKIEFR